MEHHQEVRHRRVGELLRGERQTAADAAGVGDALDLWSLCSAKNYQAELRLKKLGLESLVSQLKTANEQVRTLMSQRNDERTYQQKAALATARKEADEAYKDFVAMLNAAALMDESEYRFDELVSRINELIDYNRKYVVPKKGSGSSSGDDGGDDSGDGGDAEGGDDSQDVTPEPSGGGPDDDGISD